MNIDLHNHVIPPTVVDGADRVVIGSDHPFDMAPPDLMGALDAIPDFGASEREYVCSRTALSLLGED